MAMASVHPRLKELPPVSLFFSSSRRMRAIGQFLRTTSTRSRAKSAVTPMTVMAQQSRAQLELVTPLRRRSWCVSGTSSPAMWKVLRSISRTALATLRPATPMAAINFFGDCADLNAQVEIIPTTDTKSRYSIR